MRLRASKIFTEVLKEHGIRHAYRQVTERFVLADLVLPHKVECDKYGFAPFVPPDLCCEEIEALPKAPPIEIIAKRYLTGTTKHAFVGLAGSFVRKSHPFYAGMALRGDDALPEIMIRFDWRNPLRQIGRGKKMVAQILGRDATEELASLAGKIEEYGDRVADMALTDQLADYFINVTHARKTAFLTARVLEDFLAEKDIVFCDLCMFIDESGTLVYGEISPDCGRYRHLDYGSLDKDEWRTGGSSSQVIRKWEILCELLESKTVSEK
jgi:phosphoribosylaminoimidazole-succinocarboxamide synthase